MKRYVFLFLCSLFLATYEIQAGKEIPSRQRHRSGPYSSERISSVTVRGYLYSANVRSGLRSLSLDIPAQLDLGEEEGYDEEAEMEALTGLAKNSPCLKYLSVKNHEDPDSILCFLYRFSELKSLHLEGAELSEVSVKHLLDAYVKEVVIKNSELASSFFNEMFEEDMERDEVSFYQLGDVRNQYQKRNRFEILDFTGTHIVFAPDAEIEYFPALKNLKKLVLANTDIPQKLKLLPGLARCQALEEIDLSGQDLHALAQPGVLLKGLASLPHLKKLTLSKCSNDFPTNLLVLNQLLDLLTDANARRFPALEELVLSEYHQNATQEDWYRLAELYRKIRAARLELNLVVR